MSLTFGVYYFFVSMITLWEFIHLCSDLRGKGEPCRKGGRYKWLRGEDSNLNLQGQNPTSYR